MADPAQAGGRVEAAAPAHRGAAADESLTAQFGPGSLGLRLGPGRIVLEVTAGSPSEARGVKAGMCLIGAAGRSMADLSTDDALDAIRAAGRPVTLQFSRRAGASQSPSLADAAGGRADIGRKQPEPSPSPASPGPRASVFGGFGRALMGSLSTVTSAAATGVSSLGGRISTGLTAPVGGIGLPFVVGSGIDADASAASGPDVAHSELHATKLRVSSRLAAARERDASLGLLARELDGRAAELLEQVQGERRSWERLDAALGSAIPALARDAAAMRSATHELGERVAALALQFRDVVVAGERRRAARAAADAGAALEGRASERRAAVAAWHAQAAQQAEAAGARTLWDLVTEKGDDTADGAAEDAVPGGGRSASGSADPGTAEAGRCGGTADAPVGGGDQGGPEHPPEVEDNAYTGEAVSHAADAQRSAVEAAVTGNDSQETGEAGSECAASEAAGQDGASAPAPATARPGALRAPKQEASPSFREIRERFAKGGSAGSSAPPGSSPAPAAKSPSSRGHVKSLVAKFGKGATARRRKHAASEASPAAAGSPEDGSA
ncbi:hypothetical protein FNF31_07375 [Cafeteria roenbergensis]|uniref:PDZ domain-containing protein n=1 Tax=Cafeteria roenbergensis TaxID=33653 RepID=A0A5A8C721_CAFRO|nr:hypothetical protein FNF31_07375 [Cafeteria roenbergensis]